MKSLLTFLLFFFFVTSIFSQTFRGQVIDNQTKEAIQFAQIYFVDLKTGTIADEFGFFNMENIKQNNIHIQVSLMGYETLESNIQIDTQNVTPLYLEKGHYDLKEIVVSAPSGRLQTENIVNVEQKKMEELQELAPTTLSEALTNIPGVEQTSTGAGIGKPTIRGLSGNKIVTYAQGIRIENQQWGAEHSLGVGEVGIEGVEVIKGPASLLYGADALGGVLYFIDERYASQNTIEGFVQTKFLSNTLGSINDVGVKVHKGKLKLNIFGAFSTHADYQVPNFNRVFNTRFDEKNIKASIGFNREKWISNIRYSYLQNKFGMVEGAKYAISTERDFKTPFQKIDNHNLSFENIIFFRESKLNITVGQTNNNRKEFEDSSIEQAIGLKLNTFTYNLKWYSPILKDKFDFILGAQGMAQSNVNDGEEVFIPDATTTDVGVFFIGNLALNKIKLQGGLRADLRKVSSEEMVTDHNIFTPLNNSYKGITFSGGAVYKMEKVKLRANISSGFRAPTTSELLSDGVHEGALRYEKGNLNLMNENATQIDFSYDYQNDHFNFSFNPFYNSIKDYIFLSPTNYEIDNVPVFEYIQKNAILYGGEVGFHYHPHEIHWVHIESNVSSVFAEDKEKNPLPLIPQTKINSTISAEIVHQGKIQLKKVFIQHIYKFQQDRIGAFETYTDAYNLVNLGVNLEINNKSNPIEISTGVKNIFNTAYIDHLSRFKKLDVYNQGVNFYFSLRLNFK